MKTIVLLLVLPALFLATPYLGGLAQQDPQSQEQPSAPQQPPPTAPVPEPQVTGTPPDVSQPDIFDQQRAERAREVERMLDAFGIDSADSRRTARQVSAPHFAPVM